MNTNNRNDIAFLDRVTSIVEARLSDEQFGVSELAKEAGLNRSKLYLKIKSLTQKSVSQFIREIRLNKAMELLQHTELNVSEVSYEVGFSSPAYFNNCFHKHFGFAPGAAKNHAEVESDSVIEGSEVNSTEGEKVIRHSSKLPLAAVVIIALLGSFLAYHTLSNSQSKNDPGNTPKSIAILPLRNLSNNPEIQYIADGIMEDILTRLSYIDGLVVTSRISSEEIGNRNLTAKEVAKELNVGYFLEGSILPENEKIRINVQLISAKEDKHVWANHFDKDLTNILPFITEVSGQITDQLEIILSPEEKGQVEKIYTENKEAYKLYLEGRFYYQLRTEESFEKSIELYSQALALDSGFSLAYAGLADSYVTRTWYGFLPRETGIPTSRAMALKALKIDNNLAEAHATLGGIATYFDHDWDKAEKELKRALKINPNYMRAYKLYSEYMDVIGNREMARQYIDKALMFNPNYPNLLWHSYFYYVREGRYDKALVESNKLFYLKKEEANFYWRNFKVWLLQDRMPEAVEAYTRIWNIQFPDVNANFIEKIYMDAGKEGFIDFVINNSNKITIIDDQVWLYLSELYALINKKDSAMICLEKSFGEEAACARIKDDPFFRDLKIDPRFIALLRKMNLADSN